MTLENFENIIKEIVAKAQELNVLHTSEKDALVNYACIFTHNIDEYEAMLKLAKQIGNLAKETGSGLVFHISPMNTKAGSLKILKIRIPDPNRPERGDADFTINNFSAFKDKFIGKPGFKLIQRSDMEMIELIDPNFDVLAYYSNPPLATVLNIEL